MRRNQSFAFLFFALLPLLLALRVPQGNELLHQVSLTLAKPVFVASAALSRAVQATGSGFYRLWNLYRLQEGLEKRVGELERELVEGTELEKENERLRALLDFKKTLPKKTIPARVIGRDLALWRKTIVLDKGSSDGIEKQMAVVSPDGLVGRVIEVGPFTVRAILLLDPESRVSVLFQESRDAGITEGDGSPWLRVTHMDRNSSVKVGDRVVSSGLGAVYPKGIPVGQVEMVGTEKNGLELFATVRPFVKFSKLEEVLCIASSPLDS